MKTPSSPEFAGGVWYDPDLLPPIPTAYGPAHEAGWALVHSLTERLFDVIVKKYDPKADDFIYKRYCSISLATRSADRKTVWHFGLTAEDVRIVAIMPAPDWKFVYETRLKADTTKAIADPTDWEFKP